MRKLKVKRYKQDPSHCVIAACASIANFVNPEIDYEYTEYIARKYIWSNLYDGLESGQAGRLLNMLGFSKVTIITADLDCVDYSWNKLSKKSQAESMAKLLESASVDEGIKYTVNGLREFILESKYSNYLKIDYQFMPYIRKSIDNRMPVWVSFNWDMFFKTPKWNFQTDAPDEINGEYTYHAVVINGYSKSEGKVSIVDSHHAHYRGRLKKYSHGRYIMPWEELATVMGTGDVIIPEKYKGPVE